MKSPGWVNSKRIKVLKLVPNTPDQTPKIKYNVAISLWFVDINHREILIKI